MPDCAPNMSNIAENPVRNHYLHAPERLEEHKADLDDQAKNPQKPREGNGEKAVSMQRVVFDSRHVDLFNQAVQDPNHRLRRAAEQAMRGFARAAEKPEGISIHSAAREYNVPQTFLWRWAKIKGIIPILLEGKGKGSATLIDRERAQEVAGIYHEAKDLGIQPNQLLIRKYLAQSFSTPKRGSF